MAVLWPIPQCKFLLCETQQGARHEDASGKAGHIGLIPGVKSKNEYMTN
jgi:hypothetical protein